jgi:hypothetical protein
MKIEKGIEHYDLDGEEAVTHWWRLNADGSVTAEVRVILYLPDGTHRDTCRKMRLGKP